MNGASDEIRRRSKMNNEEEQGRTLLYGIGVEAKRGGGDQVDQKQHGGEWLKTKGEQLGGSQSFSSKQEWMERRFQNLICALWHEEI